MTPDDEIPVADFYEPVEWGWTPEKAEVRRILTAWAETAEDDTED